MGKVSLRVLRVVVTSVTDSTAGGTNAQASNVELASGTVTVLGSLVDELLAPIKKQGICKPPNKRKSGISREVVCCGICCALL